MSIDPSVLVRVLRTCLVVAGLSVGPVQTVWPQEEFIVELRNGMRLGPGMVSETDSLSTNSFQQGGTGQAQGRSIQVMDDGLRRTYFNNSSRNLLQVKRSTTARMEQIEFPAAAAVERTGNPPSIRATLQITDFNKYGHRRYSFLTHRGQADILQGITLLTPTYAKVEVLRTKNPDKYTWDQRVAVTSIPAEQLDSILQQALDLTKAGEWLRLISYYIQTERYAQARAAVAEALRRFPTEMAGRTGLLGQTEQLLANQVFEEIKLRRSAGQPKLGAQLLSSFPVQSLPVETQVKLGEEVDALKQQLTDIAEVTEALRGTVAQLPEVDQAFVADLLREIIDEVTLDTSVRFADFRRLRNGTIAAEDLTALAIGGWLLGPGSGLQNFAVAKSLIRVRAKSREYLLSGSPPERERILQELRGEEGAQADLLAKLLATMKPVKSLPALAENDPEGLYRLEAPLRDSDSVQFVVQVPPEYDPNRKYPCVLALGGSGEPPEIQVNWWCGLNIPNPDGSVRRMGHATRHGYIVVSPAWRPDGGPYAYTEREHERVLACLREAFRHVSVDTDRVYISGHFDGATAAWDIAQAHPDLWAGAVLISPEADKYIVHYPENIRSSNSSPDEIPLGTYIVVGQFDDSRTNSKLGTVGTRYLTNPSFDSLFVEYQGRGRERFLAELPRIVQWMEMSSHRRLRNPRYIETTVMRPGDRFFYWLEIPQVLANAAGNPYQFDPAGSGKLEAALLDTTLNGVRISNLPSQNRDVIVWLTPDIVDFTQPISVIVRGDRSRHQLQPDIGVMLEDARTRGDLMHVFWQFIKAP